MLNGIWHIGAIRIPFSMLVQSGVYLSGKILSVSPAYKRHLPTLA